MAGGSPPEGKPSGGEYRGAVVGAGGKNRRQQSGYRGQRSGKGCGPLLATVICVVLLVLTIATYDPEPRHETSGYESRSESIGQSEEMRPGIEFRREVPYREIDFTQSVIDNIVHDFTGCCPKTEAYVQNMYGTLMQMDYADVFSTDYEYHHSFEEMLQKYGASYEFYIDGQRIDPASYDVHDLRARGYESRVTDYGGYGSVNVTTY